MKVELVSNWKKFWKWYSVHALVIAGSVPSAYLALPEKWQDMVPCDFVIAIALLAVVSGIIGRVIKQKP